MPAAPNLPIAAGRQDLPPPARPHAPTSATAGTIPTGLGLARVRRAEEAPVAVPVVVAAILGAAPAAPVAVRQRQVAEAVLRVTWAVAALPAALPSWRINETHGVPSPRTFSLGGRSPHTCRVPTRHEAIELFAAAPDYRTPRHPKA